MTTGHIRRAFWLITTCFFLSGCTAYHEARTPWDSERHAEDFAQPDDLALGSPVKVTLVDGETRFGVLGAMDTAGLTIHAPEDPESVLTLPRDQIRLVEIKAGANAGWMVVGVLAAVAGVVVMAEVLNPENLELNWGE